jgi:hypothetical protein
MRGERNAEIYNPSSKVLPTGTLYRFVSVEWFCKKNFRVCFSLLELEGVPIKSAGKVEADEDVGGQQQPFTDDE